MVRDRGAAVATVKADSLEDRCMLAAFNAFSAAADGSIGSLRDAVVQSNFNGQDDIIFLDAGVHTLNIDNVGGVQDNTGAFGDLDFVEGGTTVRIVGAGAGNTVISQQAADRVFHVAGGANVIFENLTIADGTALENGTEFGFAGATPGNGGGILVQGSDVDLFGVVLINNTATVQNGSGGGVFVGPGGSLDVFNSEFINNTANRAGGAIEDASGAGLGLTVDNSVFFANDAGTRVAAAPGNGGAIHITGPGDSSIFNSLFEQNTAAAEGGAIWNDTGSMEVSGSTISLNVASGDSADQGGGGLFNNGGVLAIANSFVGGNLANGASGSGGGALSTGGSLFVGNTRFEGNSAFRAGGGIEAITGVVLVDFTTFIFNTTGAFPGNGGAVHITGAATTTVTNSLVLNNFASAEGGGLWNSATGIMSVINTTIADNGAGGDAFDQGGGGIFNDGGTLVVSESDILSNDALGALGGGGGIFSVDGAVAIQDTVIGSNFARAAGGGMEVIAGDVAIQNSSLEFNVAGEAGSGIGFGGGISATFEGIDVAIADSSIIGNTAEEFGGGIASFGSRVAIARSAVSNNVAFGTDGGGIFNSGILAVAASQITGNVAADNGGGIFNDFDAIAGLAGTFVTNNTADDFGGGIFNDGFLNGDSVVITQNAAAFGGGVWTTVNGTVDGRDSFVGGNFGGDLEFD